MKKHIIFIAILSFSQMFCQSKKETEEWIIDIYNQYERELNLTSDLIITDNKLYYDKRIEMKDYCGGFISVINIKDINKIEIKRVFNGSADKVGWSVVNLYFSKNKGKVNHYTSCENIADNWKLDEGTMTNILLSSNLFNDKMEHRLEKALLHLIKLYGGNATIKKEPF